MVPAVLQNLLPFFLKEEIEYLDKLMKNIEDFTHCEFREHSFSLDLPLVLCVLLPHLPKCIIDKIYEPG